MRIITPLLFAASIGSSAVAAAEVAGDHVVILLDSSGSMEGWKMNAAKKAVTTVVRGLPQSTSVGILVFPHDNGRTWTWPLGPRNDAELLAAVDRINAGGGTPLGSYLKTGADRLLAERAKSLNYGRYRLVVITDGEASGYDEERLMERSAPEIVSRGLEFHAIGVDMRSEHTLARYAHSYQSAKDAHALEEATRKAVTAEATIAPNDDATSEELFASIAGFDPGVAAEAYAAFGTYQNYPLGTPPPQPAKTGGVEGDGTPSTAPSAPPMSNQAPNPSCGCRVGQDARGALAPLLLAALGILILHRRRLR